MGDGMTTEELKPPEVPKEPALKRAQRLGRRLFFCGLALGGVSYVAPLVAATATGSDPIYDTRSGAIFGSLATMTLGNLATAITVVGGIGWLAGKYLEPFWTAVAEATRGGEVNQRLIVQLTHDTRERYENIVGLVGAAPAVLNDLAERVAEMEKAVAKVPSYAEAVLDGFDLARGTTGEESDRR